METGDLLGDCILEKGGGQPRFETAGMSAMRGFSHSTSRLSRRHTRSPQRELWVTACSERRARFSGRHILPAGLCRPLRG
jgi:hypothetical protein